MGTLYREIVRPRHNRAMRFILFCIAAVAVIDVIFLLSNYKQLIAELAYVGYGIFPVAIFTTVLLWIKSKVKYRYAIIDNELIIERFYGDKRKVVLNINAKYIKRIEKLSAKAGNEKILRHFNFACSGNKKNTYRCLYSKDGKMYSFCFEPSDSLINKINMLR
jgi:hypothetical protein